MTFTYLNFAIKKIASRTKLSLINQIQYKKHLHQIIRGALLIIKMQILHLERNVLQQCHSTIGR